MQRCKTGDSIGGISVSLFKRNLLMVWTFGLSFKSINGTWFMKKPWILCSCFLLFCWLLIFEDPRALYSVGPEMETVDLNLIFPEDENMKMVQMWVTLSYMFISWFLWSQFIHWFGGAIYLRTWWVIMSRPMIEWNWEFEMGSVLISNHINRVQEFNGVWLVWEAQVE